MSDVITRSDVESIAGSIADDVTKKFVEGDVFRSIIRQAIREAVEGAFRKIADRIDVNEGKLLELECKLSAKQHELASLAKAIDTHHESLQSLQRISNDQEQYSRRNCLRFFGIPEADGENTDELICKVASEHLKLAISKNDIERSHRLGAKKDTSEKESSKRVTRSSKSKDPEEPHEPKTKPRVIIARFISYRVRRLILLKRSELKGKKMGIDEDLTRINANLLKKTKDTQKIIAAWSSDGRIIALLPASGGKTVKRMIRDESDLDTI